MRKVRKVNCNASESSYNQYATFPVIIFNKLFFSILALHKAIWFLK